MGTINFLENIRKINNKIIFIYSSSDKAYGELNKRKEYKSLIDYNLCILMMFLNQHQI